MIRKFNYTDRVRIRRNDVEITTYEENGTSYFEADLSNLSKYDFPIGSPVYLEAYRLSTWMRFDYGCIGNITPKNDCHLNLFESVEGIKFRIKVTASGDFHKLLAEADAVPLRNPKDDEEAQDPLLPVIPSTELGDEVYRVDFSRGSPELLINRDAGNYKEIGLSAAFISLAIPAILREILTQIVLIEKQIESEDSDDWHSRWLRFIRQIPGIGDMPDIENQEDCSQWIQDAVSAFSRKQKIGMKFKEFWRDNA